MQQRGTMCCLWHFIWELLARILTFSGWASFQPFFFVYMFLPVPKTSLIQVSHLQAFWTKLAIKCSGGGGLLLQCLFLYMCSSAGWFNTWPIWCSRHPVVWLDEHVINGSLLPFWGLEFFLSFFILWHGLTWFYATWVLHLQARNRTHFPSFFFFFSVRSHWTSFRWNNWMLAWWGSSKVLA